MKTFFVLFPYLVLFLAMLTFVRLVSDRLRTRLAWALVLTAFASKFLVFEVFGGDTFTPQLPERLLWAINWAYSGFMILAVLSTLAWLARLRGRAMLLVASLARRRVRREVRRPGRREARRLFAVAGLPAVATRRLRLRQMHPANDMEPVE